jgi:hypothetical protein
MLQHPENPIYHMLTEGDLILRNDEYYDYSADQWITIKDKYIGELYEGPFGYYDFIVIRRKNNPIL